MEEIINKVANSKLEVFDLEDYYINGIRVKIDISQWLHEGFILKEADFREGLKNHDFSQYKTSTIYRRIERRMAVHQVDSMDGYVQYLRQAYA